MACYQVGQSIGDHFVGVNKTIPMPKGSIAFAQSYFAIQTRKQEVLEERIRLIERLHARQKLIATETELSGFGRFPADDYDYDLRKLAGLTPEILDPNNFGLIKVASHKGQPVSV